MKTLIESKRLALILDLDLTLLNTVRKDSLFTPYSLDDIADVFEFYIEGDDHYCVKFRPGIVQFLQRVSELFDIHVYTMGTRGYADAILDIIINKLMKGVSVFNGKILTRCDTNNAEIKNISSILPGLENITLILDDNPKIWDKSKQNVVPIYPYKFFRSVTASKNSQNFIPTNAKFYSDDVNENRENQQPTNCEIAQLDKPKRRKKSLKIFSNGPDTHLNSMYQVLRSVHYQYFKNKLQLNVTEHLRFHRSKVLLGVNLLFSGVFPLGTNPEEHTLWQHAQYFGAQCHSQFNEKITHLVAAREGTDKVLEAVRRGSIFIVTPNWLYDSLAHWIRLQETDFRLGKFPSFTGQPPVIEISDLTIKQTSSQSNK